MILFEPNKTAYDLHFRLFGVPVRIHPIFWLFTAAMGWSWTQLGLSFLLAWIGAVFVSILIHEFGHVGMFALFGVRSHVVLYGFGGLAIGTHLPRRRFERILVSLGGPLAGFLFIGLVMGVLYFANRPLFDIPIGYAAATFGLDFVSQAQKGAADIQIVRLRNVLGFALFCLLFINTVWGLLNLLPIWPLDGGHVMREICDGAAPGRGVRISLSISLVLAGVMCVHGIMAHNGKPLIRYVPGNIYVGVLFGLLAIQSFMELQKVNRDKRWLDEHWHRD